MAFHPPTPETVWRRAAARKVERAATSASLFRRMAERAAEEGPESIYAEMLTELSLFPRS